MQSRCVKKAKTEELKDLNAFGQRQNDLDKQELNRIRNLAKARQDARKSVETAARSVVGLQTGTTRGRIEQDVDQPVLPEGASTEFSRAATATRALVVQRKLLDEANDAVKLAETGVARSLETTDVVLQKNAASTLQAAEANVVLQRQLVRTALIEQAAAKDSLTASLGRARTGSAVSKAFTAQGAQMVGLRGAALSANAAFIAAAAGLILFTKAVEGATALQTNLSVFAATAGATADELARAGEVAQELGRDVTLPAVAASDAAEALVELAKAGLSVEDSLSGARGVLQLATAAGIENAQATELAASALNAFGLSGDEAVHVADVLANAANESQGSIVDMGVALQQASAVARQAGLSLEETSAILTLFARAGLKGSDAGTSFRTMMLRLINPTAKAQRIINSLGLSIRDEFGRVDVGKFLDDFAKKTANLTKRQQDQKLAILTGQDAIRGAAISLRAGGEGIDEFTRKMNKQGTAADLAAARVSGFAGALENFKNQLATSGTALANELLPVFSNIVDGASLAVLAITKIATTIQDLRREAAKPIEVVIDLIPGESEAKDRFKDTVTSIVTESVPQQVGRAIESVKAIAAVNAEGAADFNAIIAQNELPNLIANLNQVRGSASSFDAVVRKLQQMQEEMKGGSEETRGFRELFADFVAFVQSQSVEINGGRPITVPIELLGPFPDPHAAGELTKKEFLAGFGADLPGSMFLVGKAAKDAFNQGFGEGELDPGVKGAIAEARQQIKEAGGRVSGLEEEADLITIGGGDPQKLKANLQKEFREQQKIIDQANLVGPADQGARGDALKARRAAVARQAAIVGQIKQIDDQAAADAKKAKDDAEKKANEADQNILDALFPATRKLETRALIAEGTARLNDDIAVAKAQIQDNLKRIAVINKSFNDRQKAAQLIADLRDDNVKLNQQIQADIQGFFDAAADTFNLRLAGAQATGNFDRQIRLINDRMKDLVAKLKNSKDLVGDARIKVQNELEDLFNQRQQIQRTRVDEKIALGQSIFDLTGNKNPLLQAITAAVAITNKQIVEAKKAGRSTTVLKTVLNGYLNQRKEVLEDAAKEAKQGTTAFDLLSQFTQTFNETAGNLVGPDQPFVSPNAFTKTIQPFLTRKKRQPGQFSFDTGGTPDSTDRAIQRLIDALDKNTLATQGNSAASGATAFSMPNYVNVTGQRALAMQKFWEARGARDATNG